jgi:hypothetical protein
LLIAEILKAPGLADRLEEVLRPDLGNGSANPPPTGREN